MSARAYQSGAANKTAQNEAAQSVIVSLLKKSAGLSGEERFGIAQAVGGGTPNGAQIGDGVNFSPTDDNFSWAQGVRYSFRGKMLVGVQIFGTSATQASAPERGNAGEVLLTSESWLGREPTIEECEAELRARNVSGDNGC